MLVKICGVTTIDVAKAVEKHGATFIGFVFAKSSRRILPEDAKTIAEGLSPHLKKVGVFVNESVEKMEEIAQLVGLDYIQLHGDEPKEIAEQLSVPVIRAFSIDDLTEDQVLDYPCDYYLIDSPGANYRGGSGKPFDWDKLNTLNISRDKVILAGGLSVENVQAAIKTVGPVGVDVSSGVETDGTKDITKIEHFINKALGK